MGWFVLVVILIENFNRRLTCMCISSHAIREKVGSGECIIQWRKNSRIFLGGFWNFARVCIILCSLLCKKKKQRFILWTKWGDFVMIIVSYSRKSGQENLRVGFSVISASDRNSWPFFLLEGTILYKLLPKLFTKINLSNISTATDQTANHHHPPKK